MAEAVSLQVVMKLVGTMTQTNDLSAVLEDILNRDYSKTYTSGIGALQMNMWWHDQRTLTASATENLDLAGSLISSFGTTITFTSLKGIFVYAAPGNTNNVNVINHATTGPAIFLAAGDGIALEPGAWYAYFNPAANGKTVTAATADLITFTNAAGGTSVVYDVFFFGDV